MNDKNLTSVFKSASSAPPLNSWPQLGCGVGLRPEHYEKILAERPAMDWFEATSENYMMSGGRPLWVLEQVRRNYPVVLHGVSLSIGSVDALDTEYLRRLRVLADRIEPAMVSDHLCWASVERKNLHDLLPLPFTEEALDHIVRRVGQVQDFLGRRILLENVSSYITFAHSTMPEWEFLSEVACRSGCGILLDINNVYVNAVNHGFDPRDFMRGVPAEAVGYCHLAGHTDMGKWLFDTHSRPVIEPVWDLYRDALAHLGKKSTLVEWDEDIPAWEELAAEADRARKIYLDPTRHPETRSAEGSKPKSAQPNQDSAKTHFRNETGISLAEVQQWMLKRIYPDPTRHPEARSAEGSKPKSTQPHSDPSAPEAPQEDGLGHAPVRLNSQGGEPGEHRLEVYAGGYAARIEESLKEVYEAVRHLLGEGMFSHVAHEYADTRPSRSYDLGLAGKDFATFLKNARVTEKLPFLPDLASLEWRVAEAFHAYDQPTFDPAGLAEFAPEDWERLVYRFKASVSLFRSIWPIVDLWHARRTPIEKFDLNLTNRPQCALIFRVGFKVACEAIESEEFRVLEGLRSGRTLGSVCDELIAEAERSGLTDYVPPLEVWFARWSNLGLFTSIHLEEANV